MRERILLLISVVCVLVGIPALLVLSSFAEENERSLTAISGTVVSVREKGGVTIVRIAPDDSFPVVLFGKDIAGLGVGEGDFVVARGRISSYNGKPEFVAEELEIK